MTAQVEHQEPSALPWAFFAFAFIWTWAFWAIPLAISRGWIFNPTLSSSRVPLLIVGAYGPFVAAFRLSFLHKRGSVGELFKQALRWRIPTLPLAVSLLLSPAMAGAAVWLRSMQGGPKLAVTLSWHQAPALFLFLLFLGGSFNEEFGWAYAIDRIQPRWGFAKGSILLGAVWACWHLPLFFMPTQSQSHMPLWTFIVMCCSFRLLYVWAYDNSQKSILVTLLFHTSVNFAQNLFAILHPTISALKQATWMYYVGMIVLSAVVIGVAGTRQDSNARSNHGVAA